MIIMYNIALHIIIYKYNIGCIYLYINNNSIKYKIYIPEQRKNNQIN